jgi:acetoin utilization deacetylase AcuC-like enzyme
MSDDGWPDGSGMSLVIISTERFADHQTPSGHPECSERAQVMDAIANEWRTRDGGDVVSPREATHEQLARVHDAEYLRQIGETAGVSMALDIDTYTSPESFEIARLAAGAAIDGVERVLAASHRRAIALVRPPGHHAERDRAMGFCLYNNAAVAAAHATAVGVERVAIVDFDVHHGNGTQHIFEQNPQVLYLSTHQYPFYPGTGAADDIGIGPGRGFSVNVPLEAGAVDEDYQVAFADIVLPVLSQFRPGLMIVSAGFDAHRGDELGGMQLTTPAYGAMMSELRQVAEEYCGGRIVVVTEGGYDLPALGECLRAVVTTLASRPERATWPGTGAYPSRGRAAVAATREALAGCWTL